MSNKASGLTAEAMTTNQVSRAVQLAVHRLELALSRAHLRAMQALLSSSDANDEVLFNLQAEVDRHEYRLGNLEDAFYKEDKLAQVRQFERSHTWLQACCKRCGDGSPMDAALDATRAYIDASSQREFSYSDTFNPEGIDDAKLDADTEESHNLMMAALASLSDEDARHVLLRARARDHDGSMYSVTSVEDVRQWRDKYGMLTIEECRRLWSGQGAVDDDSARQLPSTGEVNHYTGYIRVNGEHVRVDFRAPKGAAGAELDSAFLQALHEESTIETDYLVVGSC